MPERHINKLAKIDTRLQLNRSRLIQVVLTENVE